MQDVVQEDGCRSMATGDFLVLGKMYQVATTNLAIGSVVD